MLAAVYTAVQEAEHWLRGRGERDERASFTRREPDRMAHA